MATLQPDSPVAQVRLGAGLLMGGQGDAASQHMETALELNPEFQQADILLVLNHLQKRDFPAAIDAAKAYQRRHLTSVTPYNLLGKVYQEAGQPEEARASFERALALDSGDPAANHNLAQMAIADEDLAAARKYYDAVLAEHEDSVPTLIQLAMLDAREGNEDSPGRTPGTGNCGRCHGAATADTAGTLLPRQRQARAGRPAVLRPE